MTTIGFIGSGHIGSQLARVAVAHGYTVVMSNSRGPASLVELIDELGDSARAATPAEAAAAADIAVVTVPLRALSDVPVTELPGKIVLDTNNYYPQRDGNIAALDEKRTTTSRLLQDHLPSSHVVKAFNHINYGDITTDGSPAGTVGRRALAIAGDDAESKRVVRELLDTFGFDAVDLGGLDDSWRVERDTPAYGVRTDVAELTDALARAER